MDDSPEQRGESDAPTEERADSDSWLAESMTGRFPDRFWMLVTGLLVVTLPALTLLIAYVVLTATRSVAIGQLTVVEAVELYLIEVVVFAVFSYLLYRLTLYTIRRPMTESVQADESSTKATRNTEQSEPE